MSPGELGEFLNPTLFKLLVEARLPYPKQGSIDFAKFGRAIFIDDDFGPVVRDKVWPALIALSKIGLDYMPDLSNISRRPPILLIRSSASVYSFFWITAHASYSGA